jgi:hypothetical protein
MFRFKIPPSPFLGEVWEDPPGLNKNPNSKKFLQKIKNDVTF